jgi:ribosomal protein L7Ae-like RNA K-turn-binding protein
MIQDDRPSGVDTFSLLLGAMICQQNNVPIAMIANTAALGHCYGIPVEVRHDERASGIETKPLD